MASLSSGSIVGGTPTTSIDVPICSVFLVLYATGVGLNLYIFRTNRRQHHKFFLSILLYALCMIRVVSCAMRISWARAPKNSGIAIAAQILNSAGVLFIYVVNLVFAQRILRAKQPKMGWNRLLGILFKAFYGVIVGTLIMAIVALVIFTQTKDPGTLQAIRDVLLASTSFVLVMAVLPLFLLAVACHRPSLGDEDMFGRGSMTGKMLILTTSTCLATMIAGFRAGSTYAYAPAHHGTSPVWYHSRAAFYCFGYALEVTILALFLITRVDQRFYIPPQCKGPGDYSRLNSQISGEQEKNTGDIRNL